MNLSRKLFENFFILQLLSQIPRAIFLSLEDDVSSGAWTSNEANTGNSAKEVNSNLKTMPDLVEGEDRDENEFPNEPYLNERNERAFNDYSADLSSVFKRNARIHKDRGKLRKLISYNKPNRLRWQGNKVLRKKGKNGLRGMKINELKKNEDVPSHRIVKVNTDNNNYNSMQNVDGIFNNSQERFTGINLLSKNEKDTVSQKDYLTKGADENKDIGLTISNSSKVGEELEKKFHLTDKMKLEFEGKPFNQYKSSKKVHNESGNYIFPSASLSEENKKINNVKGGKLLNHGHFRKITDISMTNKDNSKDDKVEIPMENIKSMNSSPGNFSLEKRRFRNNHNKNSIGRMSSLSVANENNDEERYLENQAAKSSNHKNVLEKPKNIYVIGENDKQLTSADYLENIPQDSEETQKDDENLPLVSKKKKVFSNGETFENQPQQHEKNELVRDSFKDIQFKSKNRKRKRQPKNRTAHKERVNSSGSDEKSSKTKRRNSNSRDDTNTNIDSDVSLHDTNSKRNQRDITNREKNNDNDLNSEQDHGNDDYGYLTSSAENDEPNDIELHDGDEIGREIDVAQAKEDVSPKHKHRNFNIHLDNKDKYSYREPLQEDLGHNTQMDNSRIGYNVKHPFSRRSHGSKQKDEVLRTKEKCVDYKKVTKKPTCVTTIPTETCSTKETTCPVIPTTLKCKSTSQTVNNLRTTVKAKNDIGKNMSNNEIPDIMEQYLCGQLADAYIVAVMAKVKRSRKLYKELGFRNDSEDTSCDRCIETKPSKMPDKETMKIAMGKCVRNSESKSSCINCYSVPRSMEKFLNLLVSYEKEFENSVYSKIRDDSSFIFTGDYPEQLTSNENSINDKYNFNKDTLEKENLIDESIEEKHNDQSANREVSYDENHPQDTENLNTANTEHNNKEITKLASSMNKVNLNAVKSIATNSNKQTKDSYKNNGKIGKNELSEEEDRSFLLKKKYSSVEDPSVGRYEHSFDRISNKQRRKVSKSDKLFGFRNNKNSKTIPDYESEGADPNHSLRERNYAYIDETPQTARLGYKKQVSGRHEDISGTYDKVRQRHNIPSQIKSGYSRSKNGKPLSFNLPTGEIYNHANHDRSGLRHHQNTRHSVVNGFMSSDWGGGEYDLLPNQPSEEDSINNLPKKRTYSGDYEESLNMVKRESEVPYEDEPLFFEVPNIEYDLY